jgi:hypothetical protein
MPAKLDLLVGLLLIQQQPRDRADRRLAVDDGTGAVQQRVEALELRLLGRALRQRVLHDRHSQPLGMELFADGVILVPVDPARAEDADRFNVLEAIAQVALD